jgi:hypothetical protein
MPEDQFEGNKARFNRLAKPHVVGDEQADPRHLDSADDWVELVILDIDARAKRGLDIPHVGGGGCPPTDSVEERVEPVGSIEAGRLGEGDSLDDLGTRLDLPDDLKLFAEGIVLDRKQGDEVLSTIRRWLKRRRREGTLIDVANDPAT